MSSPSKQRLLFAALAAVMSFHFAMTYARTLPMAWWNTYIPAYGDAGLPFRPRLLTRYAYRLAYHIWHDQPPAMAHGVMTAQQVTIFFIAFLMMPIIIYLTRASIGVLLGKGSPLRWFSLVTVYMCCYQYLLTPQNRSCLPYDLPAVAAFAIALYAIVSHRRWLLYATLIVASFNRETTFFLPPIFLIFEMDPRVPLLEAAKRLKLWQWADAGFQLALCVAIVHWCNVSTNAVLGPTWALPKNIHFLLNPMHTPTLISIYGFLWVPYVLFFRRIGDVRLQRVALLFPFWFGAMVWKADLLEIRVQSEWVPYLTMCLALILRNSLLLRTDVAGGRWGTPAALPGTALL